jgi:hypothetical protein
MKKLFFFIALLMTIQVAKAQPSVKPRGAEISFEKLAIDYGTIKVNAEPLRKFTFKNTGDKPLIITDAKGSCGCTVPDYPKHPIAPGASSAIDVRYDTKRIGKFAKTVTVTTNDGKITTLNITGEIIE